MNQMMMLMVMMMLMIMKMQEREECPRKNIFLSISSFTLGYELEQDYTNRSLVGKFDNER